MKNNNKSKPCLLVTIKNDQYQLKNDDEILCEHTNIAEFYYQAIEIAGEKGMGLLFTDDKIERLFDQMSQVTELMEDISIRSSNLLESRSELTLLDRFSKN